MPWTNALQSVVSRLRLRRAREVTLNGIPYDAVAASDALAASNDQMKVLAATIRDLADRMETLGEDGSLLDLDMQARVQNEQQLLQQMSNVSKALHDTAMAVTRKIGS